jgi:hypothetical protein
MLKALGWNILGMGRDGTLPIPNPPSSTPNPQE